MFAKTFVSVAPLNDTSEIPSFVKHVITKRGIDPDLVYRDENSFCHLTARLPRSKSEYEFVKGVEIFPKRYCGSL